MMEDVFEFREHADGTWRCYFKEKVLGWGEHPIFLAISDKAIEAREQFHQEFEAGFAFWGFDRTPEGSLLFVSIAIKAMGFNGSLVGETPEEMDAFIKQWRFERAEEKKPGWGAVLVGLGLVGVLSAFKASKQVKAKQVEVAPRSK